MYAKVKIRYFGGEKQPKSANENGGENVVDLNEDDGTSAILEDARHESPFDTVFVLLRTSSVTRRILFPLMTRATTSSGPVSGAPSAYSCRRVPRRQVRSGSYPSLSSEGGGVACASSLPADAGPLPLGPRRLGPRRPGPRRPASALPTVPGPLACAGGGLLLVALLTHAALTMRAATIDGGEGPS